MVVRCTYAPPLAVGFTKHLQAGARGGSGSGIQSGSGAGKKRKEENHDMACHAYLTAETHLADRWVNLAKRSLNGVKTGRPFAKWGDPDEKLLNKNTPCVAAGIYIAINYRK